MQIFVQPEDFCIVKAKKMRHVHNNSLHSDQVPDIAKTEKRNSNKQFLEIKTKEN